MNKKFEKWWFGITLISIVTQAFIAQVELYLYKNYILFFLCIPSIVAHILTVKYFIDDNDKNNYK